MKNVYVTGFMGAGKSSAGRRLARLLKRRFLDLDADIARRSGRPVAELFARGEAFFRRLEAAALRRAARRRGLVVALGGGALLSAANRGLVAGSGVLASLTCAERELWRRLRRDPGGRPLLGPAAGRRQRLRRLLRRRQGLYRGADLRVSTTHRSPARAAALLARRLGRGLL